MSETENNLISFKSEVDRLRPELCLVETEDTWERITRALVSLNGLCQYVLIKAPSEMVNILRPFHLPVTKAMNSERTRLSMAASDLIASIAGVLGASFEPLLPLFLPPLLSLCGRTNKVIINHARSSIISIIQATQLPSFLQIFLQFIKDKSSSLRLVAAEGTLACLNCCNPPDLEKDSRASAIEAIIRGTARDANPEVRKLSKQMFSAYKILLPNRVESFTAPLTPTMRKYLDIRAPPTLKQPPVIKPFSKPGHMPTNGSACSSNDMRTRSHKLPAMTPATACSQAVQPPMANRQRSKEISPAQYVPVRPISRSTPSTGNIEHTNKAVAGPSLSSSVRRVIDSATLPLQVNTRPGFTVNNNPHTASVNGPRRVPLPERSTQSQVQLQSIARPKEQISISKVVAKTAPKLLVAPAAPHSLKAGKPISRGQTVAHPTLPSTAKIKISPSRKVKQTRVLPAAKPIWGRPTLRGTKPTRGKCPLNQETTTRPEQAPQPPVEAEAGSLLTLANRSTTPAAVELPPSPATSQPMSSVDKAHDNVDGRDAEHPTVEDVATFTDVEESEMESPALNASNNNNATETGLIGHSATELPSTPSMGVSANFTLATKTPISALLSSIQQGFELSPSSPLSPPQGYDLPGSSKVGVNGLKIPFSFNTTQSTRRALAT